MAITVLIQPNCTACVWVERALTRHGELFTTRDVRDDPEAEALLRDLYTAHRPGQHPRTPVTILDHDVVVFGTDVRPHLRSRPAAA